jgi:hypothetical protein
MTFYSSIAAVRLYIMYISSIHTADFLVVINEASYNFISMKYDRSKKHDTLMDHDRSMKGDIFMKHDSS